MDEPLPHRPPRFAFTQELALMLVEHDQAVMRLVTFRLMSNFCYNPCPLYQPTEISENGHISSRATNTGV